MIKEIKQSIYEITPYKPGEAGADKKAIKLSANENRLGCSKKALKVIRKFNGVEEYPDGGCVELRDKIAEVEGIAANRIICGAGSDEIIGLIVSSLAKSGDEMIYSEYGFLMYRIYALSAGVKPVIAKEKNYQTDIDAILKKVTNKTRLVFIANPNNPTGSYVPREKLVSLREKLPKKVILVIDGAYSEYVDFDDYEDGFSLVGKYDNVIATRTFSKAYGLPSLRLGYGYMSEEFADILNRTRSPFNVNSLAQKAGIAALSDQEFIVKSKNHNDKWLLELTKFFESLGIKVLPSVANFLLLDFGSQNKAQKLMNKLQEAKIITRSVASYGLPEMVRVTIGSDSDNKKLMKAVR